MKKDILFLGDIHGRFIKVMNDIKKYQFENIIIIQVGDFGIGFRPTILEQKDLNELNNVLNEKNIDMFVIRGNHDNPKFWTEERVVYSNIRLVKDYEVLDINQEKFLLVGGAYSIDRDERKEGVDFWNGDIYKDKDLYWKDEIFAYIPLSVIHLRNINYVVTHTAPMIVPPYNSKSKKWGNEVSNERIYMSNMFNDIRENNNIKKWFHGHFHESIKTNVFDTEFISLGIDEFHIL